MKKYLFVFALGAALSFLVTEHFVRSELNKQSEIFQKAESVNNKIKLLSETEYQEYLNLKDSEEKYKKADELLGKVMVLFLADLGSRLANKPVSIDSNTDTQPPQQSANTVSSEPFQTQAQPAVSVSAPNFKLKEQQLLSSKDEKEAMRLLAEVEIKDLEKQLSGTQTITYKQQNLVQGSYAGWVVFDDKSKERWQVEWTVDARWDGKKLSGSYVVILSDSRRGPFSRTNGNGEVKAFMTLPGDSNAVLVESHGGDGFMQIYPFADTGKVFGNYYLMQKDRSFKKVGVVILEKK